MEDGAGRRLQDQTRADSLDERLLGWIMNGEDRRVRQAQAPVKKDLENRRGPVAKEGYGHYDLGILKKAKTRYYCSDLSGSNIPSS